MIRSIQLNLGVTYKIAGCSSMLDLSRCLTNTSLLSSWCLKVANHESMSAWAFSDLRIYQISKILKLKESSRSFYKFLIIFESLVLYSPCTCPMTICKLVKGLSLSISSSLTRLSPIIYASNSASLFKALKPNQRKYLVTTPFKFMKMRPAPLPYELEAPSTCRIQYNPSFYFSSSFIVNFSRIIHLTMKLANIWTLRLAETNS